MIACFILVAALAPAIAPPDDPAHPAPFKIVGNPFRQSLPRPPTPAAILWTTTRDLDVFYTLIWGTRAVLRFGLLTALVTAAFGVLVGVISGYLGGLANFIILRVTDAFLAFPALAGALLILYLMLPSDPAAFAVGWRRLFLAWGITPVMIALILFSRMPYTRLINATVTQLKGAEYIIAAESLGATPARVMLRHLLPNAITPAVILAARDVGNLVVLEATFAFVGFGGLPWSTILVLNRDYIIGISGNPLTYWWVFLPITLALILFGVSWNLLGDSLNAALNPRN
jgi:peptide/nickel transport system permease protein